MTGDHRTMSFSVTTDRVGHNLVRSTMLIAGLTQMTLTPVSYASGARGFIRVATGPAHGNTHNVRGVQ